MEPLAITFVTGNQYKLREVKQILENPENTGGRQVTVLGKALDCKCFIFAV